MTTLRITPVPLASLHPGSSPDLVSKKLQGHPISRTLACHPSIHYGTASRNFPPTQAGPRASQVLVVLSSDPGAALPSPFCERDHALRTSRRPPAKGLSSMPELHRLSGAELLSLLETCRQSGSSPGSGSAPGSGMGLICESNSGPEPRSTSRLDPGSNGGLMPAMESWGQDLCSSPGLTPNSSLGLTSEVSVSASHQGCCSGTIPASASCLGLDQGSGSSYVAGSSLISSDSISSSSSISAFSSMSYSSSDFNFGSTLDLLPGSSVAHADAWRCEQGTYRVTSLRSKCHSHGPLTTRGEQGREPTAQCSKHWAEGSGAEHLAPRAQGACVPLMMENDVQGGGSARGVDIADRLPELREVLNMLKDRSREHGSSRGHREGGDAVAQGGTSQPSRARGPGNVFLVGTGPGDVELLTLKAVRLMQSADLVLYDRLVSTDILDLVHDGARLLYVGKTSGFHSRTQNEIHELLLQFAEAGATVLRLKGGDPLVFGRGGEEMDFLAQQGIHVQIVPGITAASGIAAQLGIPLTHRGVANSVRFLTGHSRKGGEDPLFVAGHAADPDTTLVVYMGLATLPGLAAKLMANGLPPGTPAVAVERGTTPQQRTVFATLEELPEAVQHSQLVSPTLLVIGKVVALSHLWSGQGEGEATRSDVRRAAERLPVGPRDRSLRADERAHVEGLSMGTAGR